MLRFVDSIVVFLCAFLLSAGALITLVVAPPVGIAMLVGLQRFLQRQAERPARPKLHIRLS